MLRATNYYFGSDRIFYRFLTIIDDSEDEHVVDNIADKVDDSILVSNDNVGAMELVDDSILVSNDNVDAKEEVSDNQVVADNLVGVHLVISPTDEEYVDVIRILVAQNLDVSMDSVLEAEEGGLEMIIINVDIKVHNYHMDATVNSFIDETIVSPTVVVMESLEDIVDNVDNGENVDNIENGVVRALKACVGVIQRIKCSKSFPLLVMRVALAEEFALLIRGLEFSVESKNNRIERLTKELEELKKEKEGLDTKLTGYSVVPPPAQVYYPPKRDMSWTRLPEFADDTITDYTRPSPSIESNPNDLQNNSSSVFEIGESTSSILSKPGIKFVKAADSTTVVKTNKDETVRKPSIKYAEMYRKTSKSSNGKSWPNNKYTHKSRPPRTAIHKIDRTLAAVDRTYVNSARPKTTQDLIIILIQRVKRLERELKATTLPTKIHKVDRGRSKSVMA
nr:hypothetical protein [Tanacetum cinerariifolium]